LNLVVNAAQAITERIRGTTDIGVIQITTSFSAGSVEIRVKDTGTGIREEHRGRVFEPFFTTKEAGKATGQGLVIAHRVIVQQHSGKIWFETAPGAGTTFIIQLPIDAKKASVA
jgi:signal transduction histidine kinase